MRIEFEQVDFPPPSSYCRLKYCLILTGILFSALPTHFIPPPTLSPTSSSPNTIFLMNCSFRTLRNLLIHFTSHLALFSWGRLTYVSMSWVGTKKPLGSLCWQGSILLTQQTVILVCILCSMAFLNAAYTLDLYWCISAEHSCTLYWMCNYRHNSILKLAKRSLADRIK